MLLLALAAALEAAPRQSRAQADLLRHPTAAALATAGPDMFTVQVRRAWAPRGADRFFHLIRARYYDRITFFRVIPNYVAQAGFHADPAVNAAWDPFRIKDDPVAKPNKAGTVSFATQGANTRGTQIFVNLADNANLDARGFSPFGEVVEGMDVVKSLYSGYGENFPRGDGPRQERIMFEGNAYLRKEFPKLDSVDSARIAERWPAAKGAAKPPNR
jgi:peptidyl-prolyl cis-trans isomerase A (cyclophilin A)